MVHRIGGVALDGLYKGLLKFHEYGGVFEHLSDLHHGLLDLFVLLLAGLLDQLPPLFVEAAAVDVLALRHCPVKTAVGDGRLKPRLVLVVSLIP